MKGSDKEFSARIYINNGAVLINVPKIIVDERHLKEKIISIEKKRSKLFNEKKRCYCRITLKFEGED